MGELGRVPFKVKGCLIDKHASAFKFQTKIARGLAEPQITGSTLLSTDSDRDGAEADG